MAKKKRSIPSRVANSQPAKTPVSGVQGVPDYRMAVPAPAVEPAEPTEPSQTSDAPVEQALAASTESMPAAPVPTAVAQPEPSDARRSVSAIINRARERSSKGKSDSGKKESTFTRIRNAFSAASREASVNENGEPSRFSKFMSGMSVTGSALKRGATAVKNGAIDFGQGVKGFAVSMHDSFSSRHAKTKWSQIFDQFSDDEILDAARSINSNIDTQSALDKVHEAGYVTAGGSEYLDDLAAAKRLNEKGYDVRIAPTMPNLHVPSAYGDAFDARVQVDSYSGIEANTPVSDIASDIRKKLGDSAQRGKDALVDESIDAVANIAYSLDKLKEIAQREDLPESAKSFFGGEQWQAIQKMLDAKNSDVETYMQAAIQKGEPAKTVSAEQAAVSQPAVSNAEQTAKRAAAAEPAVVPAVDEGMSMDDFM